MDFYTVVRTRRSVRSYRPDPIPDDVLKRIFEAVRTAPSGSNRQPWKYILVNSPELKKALAPLCGGQSFIARAPTLVAACGRNIHYNRGGYMGDFSVLVDIAIGVDHLTLAAREEGLGTCWIGSFDNEKIKELLSIPEDMNVVALTPLGYPTSEEVFSPPGQRKPIEEIVCWNKYED